MNDFQIDAQEGLQHLQRLTATEISRLFTEIAGRDALIDRLLQRIEELEKAQASEEMPPYGQITGEPVNG